MDTVLTAGLLGVAMATLGVLATALFRLDGKIEAGFARSDARFNRLDAKVDGKIDSLSNRMDIRFDRVDGRLSALEVGLAQHLEQHR